MALYAHPFNSRIRSCESDANFSVMGVEAELREIENFSAMSDLWSSCTMEPHLSMMVHYIAPDFTIKSRAYRCFFPLKTIQERP